MLSQEARDRGYEVDSPLCDLCGEEEDTLEARALQEKATP